MPNAPLYFAILRISYSSPGPQSHARLSEVFVVCLADCFLPEQHDALSQPHYCRSSRRRDWLVRAVDFFRSGLTGQSAEERARDLENASSIRTNQCGALSNLKA